MAAEFDLWANDPLPELSPSVHPERRGTKAPSASVDLDDELENLPWGEAALGNEIVEVEEGYEVELKRDEFGDVVIYSKVDLAEKEAFDSLYHSNHQRIHGGWKTEIRLSPAVALVLRVLLPDFNVHIPSEMKAEIRDQLHRVEKPTAVLADTGKHIEIDVPNIRYYRSLMSKLGAYPLKSGSYRLLMDKALDLEAMGSGILSDTDRKFPAIDIAEEVRGLNSEPIPGFTGNVDELRSIPVSVLNVVSSDIQTFKQKKGNSQTMEEKLSAFGIATLYDLLFWLPRRYIDKSDPQDISDLIEGESATILGSIKSSVSMPNEMGSKFTIELDSGRTAEVVFWRQGWLKNKFQPGSEVIITGKFGFYKGKPSLSGSSIDHSDEVALLPIVPIYKQSESKGVTTKFILSAAREMLARLGDFPLPDYLVAEGRPDYSATVRELHFPTSIENHKVAVDALAYYELVLMQVQLQSSREEDNQREGLVQTGDGSSYQAEAIAGFPWPLTESQQEAVEIINGDMASETPGRLFLNSDVGTGKTVVAQLAALRAVDSGRQAVLAAPTEVLARQLYKTFLKLVEPLDPERRPSIGLIVGGIPIKERNALKKGAKEGTLDILIGTHAVLTGTVKYKDLGIVVIDEEQKFGADQREYLLNSREDGRVPDLLTQSATPIPRSTAQVFHGDMRMIALKGKPKGRKPIITEWIQEDPREIVGNPLHRLWADILAEAEKGNQTFVVTPMVNESPKVDAASVEATFNHLRGIFGKKIGMVHGQMKQDEQRETMERFRAKDFDVIVASSVVEVGVDIPDATRVVILSADRFGASSQHQIRGRAGRNSKQGKCYLVSLGKTKSAQTRLQAMVDHTDGFEVAKIDLQTRGEGKIFSTDQAGASELIFASLARHSEKIPQAQEEAAAILASDWAERAIADSAVRFQQEEQLS